MTEMTNELAGSCHRVKKPTPKDEVMGWLLLSMLYAPEFLAMRKSALEKIGGISPDATEKLEALEALGCKRSALITAAVLGTLARKLYPPISAVQLGEIAKKIRLTVWGMKQIVPQVLVPHGEIQEDGSLEIEWSPAGGGMQLEPWIEQSLLKKATMFEALAAMCTAKEVPSRAEFGSVGHIWPLVYVEAITREPHYALVARLLQEIGVDGDMTPRRLREAYVSIKERHPAVLRWLRHATARLETHEAEGKMLLFANAYDHNESAEHTND